jgi:hypothetical protein
VQIGKSIQREPRKHGMPGSRVPKKPDGGWPLLVIPLLGDGQRGTPFVANPDASKRPLTDDEELYLNYFKQEVRLCGMSTDVLGILPCMRKGSVFQRNLRQSFDSWITVRHQFMRFSVLKHVPELNVCTGDCVSSHTFQMH